MKSILISIFASLPILLSGCIEGEPGPKDAVNEAQICIDRAFDKPAVEECLKIIDGVYTREAEVLRCAGGFMAYDVTTSGKINQISAALENGASTELLSLLNLKTTNENATTLESSCVATGNKTMAMIAGMAKSATIIANTTGSIGATQTPQEIAAAVNDILTQAQSDPASQAEVLDALGDTVRLTYTTSCLGAIEPNLTEPCGAISHATASIDIKAATSEEIGNLLLQYWQGN